MSAPNSLVSSPVRVARQAIRKTIAEASEEAGINWQTWFLTENGCYEEIPGRIQDYLGRINVTTAEYYAYRESKQREFGEKHDFKGLRLPPSNCTLSPIESLRTALRLSRSEFAKSFAVQTAYLYNCEKGKARFIPSGLRSAFLIAGLPVELVDELDARQEEFYENENVRW